MHIPIIIEGAMIGFSMAAPIGPIGILCIRRSLAKWSLSGFITGLGAATADAVFASIALFGASLLAGVFLHYREPLQAVWSVVLLYLGTKILLDKPATEQIEKVGKRDLAKDFASTFLLTMTNPITVFALTAIFAGIDVLQHARSFAACLFLIVGIFLWSGIWRFILSNWVCFLKKRTNKSILKSINTIAGAALILFACFLLLNLLIH